MAEKWCGGAQGSAERGWDGMEEPKVLLHPRTMKLLTGLCLLAWLEGTPLLP